MPDWRGRAKQYRRGPWRWRLFVTEAGKFKIEGNLTVPQGRGGGKSREHLSNFNEIGLSRDSLVAGAESLEKFALFLSAAQQGAKCYAPCRKDQATGRKGHFSKARQETRVTGMNQSEQMEGATQGSICVPYGAPPIDSGKKRGTEVQKYCGVSWPNASVLRVWGDSDQPNILLKWEVVRLRHLSRTEVVRAQYADSQRLDGLSEDSRAFPHCATCRSVATASFKFVVDFSTSFASLEVKYLGLGQANEDHQVVICCEILLSTWSTSWFSAVVSTTNTVEPLLTHSSSVDRQSQGMSYKAMAFSEGVQLKAVSRKSQKNMEGTLVPHNPGPFTEWIWVMRDSTVVTGRAAFEVPCPTAQYTALTLLRVQTIFGGQGSFSKTKGNPGERNNKCSILMDRSVKGGVVAGSKVIRGTEFESRYAQGNSPSRARRTNGHPTFPPQTALGLFRGHTLGPVTTAYARDSARSDICPTQSNPQAHEGARRSHAVVRGPLTVSPAPEGASEALRRYATCNGARSRATV
ncbi:hypothetical protein BJV74DRAFT_796378 [Russula compacta]|nr:hypothetical protein BJV74DRAFT_796378 [Russula compacta]